MSMDYSAAEFRRRARERSSGLPDSWRQFGDYRLNPDAPHMVEGMHLRDAAVLMPVVDDGANARVILTQRTSQMRKHSGQIAFPGGKLDPEDASVENAALREAEEEIGLGRHFVEIVGKLPSFPVLTGFRITPVLSVVQPGFTLVPNPHEVDSVFEVPLSFLMDPTNHVIETANFGGHQRNFYVMPYEGRRIWGITAGILRSVYERLYE
jgi:8-oxo-dGTP pyrophosphatase MutT (NUDIX family)